MELATKYNPSEVEGKWYKYWIENKLFASKPDGREPYTVVIPPPNVTGVLHMGHVLNETIQDILVRHARMEGKNACWVPGTDHASIATEAKVIKRLKEQGINKSDLTREEFLKHAWAWTEEHGGIILKQLRQLGCSCDWDRTAFTMDEERSKAVISVFCDLYRKGLIYRGLRMVNWDPERQTALSDEEVIYHEEHSKFYYMKYMVVEDPGKYAIVATTRPETIMGDVAVCINPKEEKNQWLKGKHLVVPIVGRVVPVIEDRYVEIGFGTGCLKVTPAHDANDYMLGQKYNLTTYDIFTADAHIDLSGIEEECRNNCATYQGMDRFDCRKQIAEDLINAGLMDHVEDYDNKVGYSERTNVPIEPRLSLQWFIRMQHFADIALPPVMNNDIVFYPTKYKNTYRNWLENIKDWCISRQLWWGHRIPAYYDADLLRETGLENYPNDKIIVSETKPEGNYVQDEGALDTWFSSWLWPISLFNGIAEPDNKEIQYYYPTADLVTGPDIIFFWVARMIMAGYEYQGKMPFRHVYFTGIVRDKLGRKMSKSLGNSPDPLDLIERYGADGVRMGIMLSAPAGNDILYDDALCEQGRNFCNKIWNSFRLVKGWAVDEGIEQTAANKKSIEWFSALTRQTAAEIQDLFGKYRLSEALMTIYKLYTDEFSGWYLEMIKPAYGTPIDKATYETTLVFFETLMQMLHPFMPFITEELWQSVRERKDGESIMTQTLHIDAMNGEDAELLHAYGALKDIISGVRAIRQSKNIAQREPLALEVVGTGTTGDVTRDEASCNIMCKMAYLKNVEYVAKKGEDSVSFLVGTTEYAVPLSGLIDAEAEIQKAEAEIQRLEGFKAGIGKKLQNERFVQNAPAQVVEMERKKFADAESKIQALRDSIATLKK